MCRREQIISKKTRRRATCAPRERRRPLSMVPIWTSWQSVRSTNSLRGKKLDLETASKWLERSGSANWWRMSSLILKTIAMKVTQTKAKSLNMTAPKNVKKLLESGLSVPHPHKQLPPNMCLSFRILMLELFKSSRRSKEVIFLRLYFLWNFKVCVWCFPKSQFLISCRTATTKSLYLYFLLCLLAWTSYPHSSKSGFCLRALCLRVNTGTTLLWRSISWDTAKERKHWISWKSLRRRFMGKTLLCGFLRTGSL